MASFTSARRQSLRGSLARTLSCLEPLCFLTLRLSPGSVAVVAIMVIPNAQPPTTSAAPSGQAAAAAAATAAAVEAAATALAAQPTTAISASLGVSVEAVAPVAVTLAVVPLVLAPPPPFPPPPSSAPLPPSRAPPSRTSTAESPSPSPAPPLDKIGAQELSTGTAVGLSPVALLAMILAAVAAALTVLLVVAHRVLRRRRALLGKADGAANSMHESMTIATAFTKLGEGSPEKSQPEVNVLVSATAQPTPAGQPEIYI